LTVVRRAAEADAAAIAELMGMLGYPSTEAQVRARLARFEAFPGAEVLVAEREGVVVGAVGLSQTQLLAQDSPSCRITALAVSPRARRQGVATALLDAVEEEARRQGCFRLEVTSRPDRREAHAFYTSRGFEERRHRFAKELE
jgi:N-acetylglutamate synthase-like GNAT family acetyltransferase